MATYRVTREYVYTDVQEIEAESETEALELADQIEPSEDYSHYHDIYAVEIGE